MNDSDFDADDETRRMLRAADTARALPSADPARVSALLEETMSQPVNEPKSPARSRLLLIAGAAVVLIGRRKPESDTPTATPREPVSV